MQAIKCLLLDDEPLALDILERYISQFSHLQLVGRLTNPLEGISFLKTHSVDLIFLDIRMPMINGLNLLQTLPNPPAVIITTAYSEYAVEGFNLNVLDYLLKPVSLERFVVAINKYRGRSATVSHTEPDQPKEDLFIYFKSNKKMIKVFMDDILWIESLKDYVKIITQHKTIISYERIGYLEEKLPENRFLRIHRSFIVSTRHIQSLAANFIQIGDQELPIGRLYKKEVLKQLKFTS
jgi:DNA-binding LytR/AlgR family response regulator